MNRREAILGATAGILGFGASNVMEGAETKENEAIKRLTEVRSAFEYTDEPVAEDDLKKILQVGLNAPSALNRQPWFFAAVTDRKLLAEIDKAAKVKPGRLYMTGSPAAIFVCADDSDFARFDAGTASDRMSVAAFALGYGCKTVASPCAAVNEQYKEKLGIPEKYQVIAVLLLGVEKTRSVDGVSGATTRVPFEEKVSLVK